MFLYIILLAQFVAAFFHPTKSLRSYYGAIEVEKEHVV